MSDQRAEFENIQREIREFDKERERIKQAFGALGGMAFGRRDTIINIVLLVVILTLFVLEVTIHLIPTFLSLEIGVFLVSFKIVLMIHSQQKAYHFQFWMLNTIEFRINKMERDLSELRRSGASASDAQKST